eukprot:5025957-Pyramimonas_sp.AAC.1
MRGTIDCDDLRPLEKGFDKTLGISLTKSLNMLDLICFIKENADATNKQAPVDATSPANEKQHKISAQRGGSVDYRDIAVRLQAKVRRKVRVVHAKLCALLTQVVV